VNFRIVIPSARATNLVPCVQSILTCEPTLSPSAMLVVDDGARAESEGVLPAVTWIAGVKPFVFARNVNLGISAAGDADVILMNDDARLMTPFGFTDFASRMHRRADTGICSAGVDGVVCNPRQRASERPWFHREESDQLAFVCVYIRRTVIDRIGLLDERFIGYGFEDFDYCRRARVAGFRIGIWRACVVDHSGQSAASSYRTRPDVGSLFDENRRRYLEKWTAQPAIFPT
jgi:GT2 family glycosyltransferase